jgi:RND family efflux transporter MFP subunit
MPDARVPALALLAALSALAMADPGAAPVTSRPVSDLAFHPQRSAPAQVVPRNEARIAAEVGARVLALPLRAGARVAAGDLLARLDCRDYDARLVGERAAREALAARLDLARAQLRRARDLKEARNISDEEVDRREAELAALRAELRAQAAAVDQAALQVERCVVTAPYDAVVAERLASVGDLAAPGTGLLRLVELAGAEVSARVAPAEAAAASGAPETTFLWLGRRHPLRWLRTPPLVDPATRTVEVRLGFTGETAPPGASGRLLWTAPEPHLPADLLVRRDGRLGVFLVEEGRARFHPLPGALEGQPAVADLPGESRVIVAGREALAPGDAVREAGRE